jgi:hypothetical protein
VSHQDQPVSAHNGTGVGRTSGASRPAPGDVHQQDSLFGAEATAVSVDAAWARLDPPAGYDAHWGQLARAAIAAGLSPIDLVTAGDDGRSGFHRLAEARRWSLRTVATYAKVARYGGLTVERVITPEPDLAIVSLSRLTLVRDGAGVLETRAVAWCALALAWPASAECWRQLRRDDVTVSGIDAAVCGRRVAGGGTPWQRWEDWRARIPGADESPWALCSVRAGHFPDQPAGVQLSRRGLQDAFKRHAQAIARQLAATAHPDAAGYDRLTYDSLRRLLVTRGIEPVDRGRVRATRASSWSPSP